MLSDRKNFIALHLGWFLSVLLATAAAIVLYAQWAIAAPRWPGGGSLPGLVLGTLAGFIILFECALWLRRTRWFRTSRWLGSAQLWMKAHIWLGLLSVPLVLLHSGFSWGGTLTTLLAVAFVIVIASGIIGLVAQNIITRMMLEHLPDETIGSQIEVVSQQLAGDAERIVALTCGDEALDDLPDQSRQEQPLFEGMPVRRIGAMRRLGTKVVRSPNGNVPYPRVRHAEELRLALDDEIKPFLVSGRSPSGRLGSLRRTREYFGTLRETISPEATPAIHAIQELCERRWQFIAQRRLHNLLHGWLLIHLPLSIALVMLLVIHIVSALRFG